MVGSRKLDHARGAVYADHTALGYSQGELVTYSAVPTTHIEHRFVAVETVARQHGHRDCELNLGIGAVKARVPMCRRILHWCCMAGALRGIDALLHSQHDFPSGVALFHIPQRLGGLTQLVTPVDDRCQLPRLHEIAQGRKVFFVELRHDHAELLAHERRQHQALDRSREPREPITDGCRADHDVEPFGFSTRLYSSNEWVATLSEAPDLPPNTSSPSLNRLTFLPTASTVPAKSTPSRGFSGFPKPSSRRTRYGVPSTSCQSRGLTDAACTLTRTSLSAAVGLAMSSYLRTSGEP